MPPAVLGNPRLRAGLAVQLACWSSQSSFFLVLALHLQGDRLVFFGALRYGYDTAFTYALAELAASLAIAAASPDCSARPKFHPVDVKGPR